MPNFAEALNYVLDNEGRTYDEPPKVDQPTNSGITAGAIAEYRGVTVSHITRNDVKNLTPQEIENIYRSIYWNKVRGDEIKDQAIATCCFDTAVNRGVNVAIKYAQRACNLNGAQLVCDGRMGFHTLAALNQAQRGPFIRAFQHLEVAGYMAIIARHPEDHKYENGWLARARRILTLIALPVVEV